MKRIIRNTLWFFVGVALAGLISLPSWGADITVSWTLPTTNTDGSPIPATGNDALRDSRIERGSCTSTSPFTFGNILDNMPVPYPTSSVVFSSLPDGAHCFRVRVSTYLDVFSDYSITAGKVLGGTTNTVPTLNGPGSKTLTRGDPFQFQLVAADADGDALTYSATNLPPGLAVNASTGLVSGTPTTNGSYSVVFKVDDGHGGTATRNPTWTVVDPPPPNPPVIVTVASTVVELRLGAKTTWIVKNAGSIPLGTACLGGVLLDGGSGADWYQVAKTDVVNPAKINPNSVYGARCASV